MVLLFCWYIESICSRYPKIEVKSENSQNRLQGNTEFSGSKNNYKSQGGQTSLGAET